MHQSVMVRPAGDAIQPGFEQRKLGIVKIESQILQLQHCADFFLEYAAAEKAICDFNKEWKSLVLQHRAPAAAGKPPQVAGIPAMRFDFLLEEPLHPGCVFSRAITAENLPDSARRARRSQSHV